MPTSEPLVDNRLVKRLAIAASIVPGLLLIWDALRGQLGVNQVNFAIRTTGMVGLVLLVLALAITPLRALTRWPRLIAMRRNLGVIGFFYIAAHFLIFFALDRQASVASTLDEIVKRRYLWFGTAALVLMIPLAITSTDAMVSRVGARSWKLLHRLTYLVVIAGVVHYYMLVKSDVTQPLAFAAVAGSLFGFRMVRHYTALRRDARSARERRASPAPARRKAFWSGDLKIARVFEESHDVKTFRLVATDGGPLPFTHVAGQYLNLSLTVDGMRVNRSYTIASPPTRTSYCEISVKRGEGAGSRHLHDAWREGDVVKVSAPAGRFVFAGDEADRVVLIAGGIGVTPMMAVVRALTDRAWPGEIDFLLSIREPRDFVFRDELAYLQSRHRNLRVEVVVSRDADSTWAGARGRITRETIERFIPNLTRGPILLCGPTPMMTSLREILVGMGVPDAEILQEEFVSRPAVLTGADADEPPAADGEAALNASVTFQRESRTADCSGLTLLEVAEEAGIDIPFECRSGICGQCKTSLVSGRVAMAVRDALTTADRARGVILACQARPLSDVVVDA
jgi:ferredoxin-NADP reductase/DMSO/TMAO reductase YedYZ heme-binding membrane subunit